MLAVVAPGQGAQTPGMLTPWLEHPAAAAALREAEKVTGLDLIRLGTTGDADEIRDTAVAQPLLTALALATAAALELGPSDIDVVAGHSIGELPAAVLAGVLAPADALRLARDRGAAMAAACAAAPTGMTAVLGGDADELDAILDRARAGRRQPQRRRPDRRRRSARRRSRSWPRRRRPRRGCVRSPVAGAFHTSAMEPAREALRTAVIGLVARTIPARGCCRTPTAPSSPPAPRSWRGWWLRSRPRCAGTCASRRWPTSASPRCSSSPRAAR